jgi:hypothetical protein
VLAHSPQTGRFGEIDPLADRSDFSSTFEYAGDNPILMNDPTGLFRRYEQDPTLSSTAINNMNPGFGSPSIDEINSITGYDSDLGADAGKENDAIYKGSGVYQLPNGDYVDQISAFNYAVGMYGGSYASFDQDYGRLIFSIFKDGENGNPPLLVTKTEYNYKQNNGEDSYETDQYEGKAALDYGTINDPYTYTGTSTEDIVDGMNLRFMTGPINAEWSIGNQLSMDRFGEVNDWVGTAAGAVENLGSGGIARASRILGWASVGVGAVMDLKGMIIYKHNPNAPDAVSPVHAGLNTTMGLVAMWGGPVGWTVSGIYFTVQSTIGWDQAMQGVEMMDKSKMQLINSGIMTYSDFKY